jgi:hypothetical protein
MINGPRVVSKPGRTLARIFNIGIGKIDRGVPMRHLVSCDRNIGRAPQCPEIGRPHLDGDLVRKLERVRRAVSDHATQYRTVFENAGDVIENNSGDPLVPADA